MMPELQKILETAYFEPLPKRFLLTLFICAVVFLISRITKVRECVSALFLRSPRYVLGGILVAALAIRLIWSISSPVHFSHTYQPAATEDESDLMNIYARSISETAFPRNNDGSVATRRSMGYPYLLGGLYAALGYQPYFFIAIQIILSLLLVWLAYFIGFSFFQNRSAAIWAAGLMAFYPENIITVNILLDEFSFFAALFGAIYFASENIRLRTVRHTLVIGILLGLATFCRTHGLFVPLIFAGAYVFSKLDLRKIMTQTLAVFALVFLVNSPWAAIMKSNYDVFSFFPAYGSTAFYSTLNDRATWHNGYLPMSAGEGGDAAFYEEKNPMKQAAVAKQLARKWAFAHPSTTAEFFLLRNLWLFGFQLDDEITPLHERHGAVESWARGHADLLRKIKANAYGVAALLGWAGLILLLFRNKTHTGAGAGVLFLTGFFIAYWMAIHGFFFGFRKYRWFFELLMLFPAAFFLQFLTTYSPKAADKAYQKTI